MACGSKPAPGMISTNTLRHRQNGLRFAHYIFKWIFFNKNCCILIKISLDGLNVLTKLTKYPETEMAKR